MSSVEESTRVAQVSTPSDREIRIEREFDASRERVWAAYSDPAAIAQWWGPRHYEVIVEEMDHRVGGTWCFLHRSPDGEEHRFRGIYREIVPLERIVQTFEWAGMPGYVSLETATFEDLGERTKVTTVSVFYATEERDGMLGSGMEGGMNQTFQRLDEYLAREAA